jgi:hypothetical protein
MGAEVAKADGMIPLTPLQAEKFGTGELLKPDAFDEPEEKGGFLSGMSTTEKMAMAAQLGSLLRGPAAPAPPSAPTGGQGINMQPVFQGVTLGQLGRR